MTIRETDLEGGVRVLTLARPPMNAIDLGVVQDMIGALERAAATPAVRALVVTGDARSFSAGLDVKLVPAYGLDDQRRLIRGIDAMLLGLYTFGAPVVAALNGHAIGGGLVLALACDHRVVTTTPCRLGLAEVTAGIPFPAAAITVVRAELAPQAARILTLTGTMLAPVEAQAFGVVDELAAPDALLDVATTHARAFASLAGHRAVKAQLRAPTAERLRQIVELDHDPLLAAGFGTG